GLARIAGPEGSLGMTRTFKSKVDWWIATLAIGPGLVTLPVVAFVAAREGDLTPVTIGILISVGVLAIALPIWVFRTTRYAITDDSLEVRCGPMRESVPLTSIEAVRATHSMASAPALSLDRMEITIAGGRKVIISPDDRRGFLATLVRAGVRAAEGVSP